MTIIDVDAHFEPSANWLDEFPVLKKKLPEKFPASDPRFRMNSGEMFAYFVSDDLLRAVPPEQRMDRGALQPRALHVPTPRRPLRRVGAARALRRRGGRVLPHAALTYGR